MNNGNENNINNNSSWINKIKSIKNIKFIFVLLLIAILFFTIDYFVDKNKNANDKSNMTKSEQRLACMIEKIDGIEDCEVYINSENESSFFDNSSEEITGVLVVCHGKNTVSNKLTILSAMQKALNIKKDIIEILIL